MANSRALLSVLILTGTLAAGLVACGDDDDDGASNPSSPLDAGGSPAPGDASLPDDAAVAVDAASPTLGAAAIYAGTAARFDAAAVAPAGATFAWTITSAPPGSTAALTGGTTAAPSFVPDRAGTYAIAVTVTADGVTTTVPGTLTVVDPPVFFFESLIDAGNGLHAATVSVVGALEGDGGKPVSCFERDAGSYGNDLDGIATRQNDVWEAPDAGEPSRIVYAFQTREDGGAHTSLLASTSSSTCATPPTKLDVADELIGGGGSGVRSSRSLEGPRFSPSGKRIAYLRTVPGGSTVATVGFDGTARRDLAPLYAYGDGGASPDASTPTSATSTRPSWVDETTVAYAQATDAGWQVMTIADAPGATPTLLMACAGTLPEQVALLPGGDVLVSMQEGGGSPPPRVIRRYTPANKACTDARTLASDAPTAFALAPDGTKLVIATTNAVSVKLLDGGAVSSFPSLSPAYMAPRWVSGGRLLAWSAGASSFVASAPADTRVMAVMQEDGGAAHQVTPTDANRGVAGAGIGICSMGRSYGPGAMLFGMAGVLALRVVRRRKKS